MRFPSPRRQDLAPAFAEADGRNTFAAATGPQDDLVTVLKEFAYFARSQLDWFFAALGDFQQAAELTTFRPRQGARAEQVSGLQLATIDAVVGDHLRHGPVHVLGDRKSTRLNSSH